MANEITINYGLSVRKGNLNFKLPQNALSVTMTGSKNFSSVQDLTTTPTLINVTSGSFTPGWSSFTNMATSGPSGQYVYVATTSGGQPLVALNPNEIALLPLATLTVWANMSSGSGSIGTNIFAR